MVPPTQIGQYEILGIIGRGAMGVVYRAQDTKMFRRLVAIKVIAENLIGDADALRRFNVEQETVAGLQHPNIVTIYDRGEFDDRQYFVMEYLEGVDLAQMIREKSSGTRDQRIEIAVQIAEALDFAHRRDVIHRDIKPSNVMVIRRGELAQAKLLDFGIVHVSRKGMTTTVTQPGTLLYMSPEQLKSQHVTPQSDLFSLGLVLFELFAGIHPFDAPSEPLVTAKILYNPPLTAREQDPDIPADLAALLAALLQKEPENRPASAAVVATELRRVLRGLSGAPTTDPPISRPGTQAATLNAAEARASLPRRPARTGAARAGAAIAVAAVVMLSAWGGIHWWNSRGAKAILDQGPKEAEVTKRQDAPKREADDKPKAVAAVPLASPTPKVSTASPEKTTQEEVSSLRAQIAGLKSTLDAKVAPAAPEKPDGAGVQLDAWGAQAERQLDDAERLLGQGGRDDVLAGQAACDAAATSIESIRKEKPDDERVARLQHRQEDVKKRLTDALSGIDKASDDLSDLFDRLNRTSTLPAPASDAELSARLTDLGRIGDDLASRNGSPKAGELRRKLDGTAHRLSAFHAFFAYLGAYRALSFKRLQDIFPRAPFEIKGSFEDLRSWDAAVDNVVLDVDGDAGTLRCRLHENILTRTSGRQTLDVDLTLTLQPAGDGWIIREHRIAPVGAR